MCRAIGPRSNPRHVHFVNHLSDIPGLITGRRVSRGPPKQARRYDVSATYGNVQPCMVSTGHPTSVILVRNDYAGFAMPLRYTAYSTALR